MKSFCFVILCLLFAFISHSQAQNTAVSTPDPGKKIQKVKAACGTCMFGMTGDGCILAVRIKNKTYFVEGTGIDDHGDPHARDGFCNKVRKAEVQGEIKENKFWATYFRLVDGSSKNLP